MLAADDKVINNFKSIFIRKSSINIFNLLLGFSYIKTTNFAIQL